MRLKTTKSSLIVALLIGGVTFVAGDAFAIGGCARQPQPGDGYNCDGVNSPYHPNNNNGIDCRSQCNAVKRCLNGGGGGCQPQLDQLNACMRQRAGASMMPNGDEGIAVAMMAGQQSEHKACPIEDIYVDMQVVSTMVRSTIAESLNISEAQVDASSDLYNDYKVSTAQAFQIKAKIEERLGVRISDKIVKALRNMDQIEQVIAEEMTR